MIRLIAALCLGLLGCILDLGVKPDTSIRCATNNECPEGMLCNPNSLFCVPSDGTVDFAPPQITSASIAPTIARLDQSVSVTISLNEAVKIPAVTLEGGRALVLATGTYGDQEFTFTLTPEATDPQGVGLEINVALEDVNGNAATSTLNDKVTFDFTPAAPIGVTLDIVPADGTPLGVVASRLDRSQLVDTSQIVGPGGALNISFELSENVNNAATLVSVHAHPQNGGADIPLALEDDINGRLFFSKAFAAEAEGGYDIVVTASDDIGNATTATVWSVLFDRSAPAQALANDPNAVVYERIPWGDAAGPARFSVLGGSGAAAGAAYVLGLDGATFSGTALGAAVVSADGAFSLALDAGDRRNVYVMTLDAAGNTLAPVKVRDTHLIATMGGKIAGSVAENPNRLISTQRFDDTREQSAGIELSESGSADIDCPGANCVNGVVSTQGLGYWKGPFAHTPDTGTLPPQVFLPLQQMAVGYDPISGRTLAFGGYLISAPTYRTTWAFDGERWRYATGGGPSQRRNARMAFDENLGQLVLFGGQYFNGETACTGGNFFCNDIWTWNGTSWATLATSGTAPSQRAGHAMAFDRSRDRLVIFGGETLGGKVTETWELDCNAPLPCDWSGPYGGAAPTTARTRHTMAYDDANNVLVMSGGYGASYLSDAWQRSGTSWSSLAADVMGAIADHALVFDDSRQELLAWGLISSTIVSGTACQRPAPFSASGITCPSFIFGPAPYQAGDSYAAYNSDTGDVVTFGRGDVGNTYVWNGGAFDRPAHISHWALGDALGGGTAALQAWIDFAGASAPLIPGTIKDSGASFGPQTGGHTFGWNCTLGGGGYSGAMPLMESFGTTQTAATTASYAFMEYSRSGYFTADYSCTWAYALPNGRYMVKVTLRARDDNGEDTAATIEGETIAVPNTAPNSTVEAVLMVTVSDGQLDIAPGPDPQPSDGFPIDVAIAAVEIYRTTPLEAFTVRWHTGSTSTLADTAILAWNGLQWVELTSGGGTPTAPSVLSWAPPIATDIERYIQGPFRTVSLAVAPKGQSGTLTNGAELTTDYIEIDARFRLTP